MISSLAMGGAASGAKLPESRSALSGIQERIRELQKEIDETEESRSELATALAAAGRALSEQGRALSETRRARERMDREIRRLESEEEALQLQVSRRRQQLAEWLRRHYREGRDARLADFLVSADPNQLARDGYYMQRIGRANLAILEAQRADLVAIDGLAAAIAARRAELAAIERTQRAQREAIAQARATYQQKVSALGVQLRQQQREVANLRLDEKRLGRLVAGLEKMAQERAARRRAEAEAAVGAPQEIAPPDRQEPSRARAGQSSGEPVVGRALNSGGRVPSGVPFGSLRGRLNAPLEGELVGRFGARRADGGTAWRGVFIRAATGAEVRAVASGEVVFADWLRGFGNLLIVDHGDGYLTIYGNNDVLLSSVGQRVAGGEAIASVGSGGSSQESGLYFEVRHRGEPVDPLAWVRVR